MSEPGSVILPQAGPPVPLFSPRQAPRLAVQGWLASRLVLLVVLLVMVWLNDWTLAEALHRWDVNHFVTVADHGYTELTETAFFPGLPLVMAFFSLFGIAPVASGVLISLVGSGMAAWGLYRLANGGVRGTVAVLAWSFAPMAVFTFVPYTESAFCALAFWAFVYAKRDRWGIASALTAAACLFRVSGLFLIGALGLVALFGAVAGRESGDFGHETPDSRPASEKATRTRTRTPWVRRLVRVAWLGIPTAVLAAYVVYLRIVFGSWTAWFSAQVQGWGRSFGWPWDAFAETLHVADIVGNYGYSTYMMFRWEVAAFLIGIAVAAICFIRKQIPEGGWVLVQVLALSSQVWLISVARSMLLWFPVFTLIGDIGGGEVSPRKNLARRIGLSALLLFDFIAMIWWAVRFFEGAWAG